MRLKSLPGRAGTLLLASGALLLAGPVGAETPTQGECAIPDELARFEHPLARTAKALAAGHVKIVAIGSSSTEGSGASTPAFTYPSRLSAYLNRRFPDRRFNVRNYGVGGQVTSEMVARFDQAVVAEKPDLVLWQVGTNAVLRDDPLKPNLSLIHDGIAKIKAVGADTVLIDPQYAPKVLAKPNCSAMVGLLAAVAEEERVEVFRRFDLMRHWQVNVGLAPSKFLSSDGLHMNDWSYACIARALGIAIAEAATRAQDYPKLTATLLTKRRLKR